MQLKEQNTNVHPPINITILTCRGCVARDSLRQPTETRRLVSAVQDVGAGQHLIAYLIKEGQKQYIVVIWVKALKLR